MIDKGIRWTSKTIHVDHDTGEIITKFNAQHNYIKVKTEKNVTLNKIRTRGTIEWTIYYTRNPQIRIF